MAFEAGLPLISDQMAQAVSFRSPEAENNLHDGAGGGRQGG